MPAGLPGKAERSVICYDDDSMKKRKRQAVEIEKGLPRRTGEGQIVYEVLVVKGTFS